MASKRIIAPLLSAFVLPGVGQLVNRQPGKGALLICLMSLLLMVGLFFSAYQVTTAIAALGDQAQQADKWLLLRNQLLKQGVGWLLALGGVSFAIWLYAVIDAARWGRKRDREAAAQATGSKQA